MTTPTQPDQPGQPDQPVRRTESHFHSQPGDAGLRLLRRSWLPPEPERALVLAHGFAEHSARYDRLGAWFAERGTAVHAYDHRGHGHSQGVRNHVRKFDEYLDDLGVLLEIVRQEHSGLPLSLLGHSMGGLIVTKFVRERQPDILAAVVSAPALALPSGSAKLRVTLGRLLRWILPRLRVEAGFTVEGLSRDPEVGRLYQADPLIDTRLTTSLGAEMMGAVAATAGRGADVHLPMLMLHGSDDPICNKSGTEQFAAGLPHPASKLRLYPGLRHEIFNEPEQEQLFADVLDWLRAREAEAQRAV